MTAVNIRLIGRNRNMVAIYKASGRGAGRNAEMLYRFNVGTGGETFGEGNPYTREICRAMVAPLISL